MKKVLIIITMMVMTMGAFSQGTILKVLANGGKGVDSLYGAVTKYYYFSTTSDITNYEVYSVGAYTVRSSAPTGSDSCHIWFEFSLDGTNWHKWTGTVPKTIGGGVYLYGGDLITTTTDGGGVFLPTNMTVPRFRVGFQHYKAVCTMYPKAYLVLKRID